MLDQYYYSGYLFLVPLSLLLYSFATLRQRITTKSSDSIDKENILLDTLLFLSCAISIPLLIFVLEPYFHFHWGIKSSYLIYMLLALAAGYLLFHLFRFPQEKTTTSHSRAKQVHADDQLLADQIRSSILNQQLYLDPDMNLQKLAAITGIPAWQVSKILNEVIGKRFYEFIAEYRTAHAKKLIDSDIFNKLTLEHIAQQSGFKSKSSFNRYFKSIEKCSPQAYKKRS